MKPLITRILRYLKPHWRAYATGQAAMLVATATALVFPLAIRGIFDQAFGGGGPASLLRAIGLLAAVFALKETAGYIKNLLLGRIGQKVTATLREDAFERLQRIPTAQFDTRGNGHWISILTNDINQFQGIVAGGIAYLLQSVLSLAGVLFLLVRLDAWLAMSLLTLLPLAGFVTKRLGARMEAVSAVAQEKLGTLTTVVSETVAGIDVIRGFSLEREASGFFRRENAIVCDKSEQAVRIRSRTGLANGLLNSAYLLVITGFGAWRVFQGGMTPGDLIAFLLYTEMIYGPILSLSELYLDVQRSLEAIRRIFGLMDAGGPASGLGILTPVMDAGGSSSGAGILTPAMDAGGSASGAGIGAPATDSGPEPGLSPRGRITFEHVTFGYDNRPVLEDLSFSVEPGETVALVGASGVGKSTLLKLIARLYDTTAGRIRIDGRDIREWTPSALRARIAAVPQQTHLFSLSIRDNIACGRPDATEEDIIEAAKRANAHDFIMALPDGYGTQLGENGTSLSGGQKQRIAIARAFVRNPDILLLDEATASLDAVSEQNVLEAMHALMRGRTTLIAAHRPATIEGANHVLVLEGTGRSSYGTHASLRLRSPAYRRLMRTGDA